MGGGVDDYIRATPGYIFGGGQNLLKTETPAKATEGEDSLVKQSKLEIGGDAKMENTDGGK